MYPIESTPEAFQNLAILSNLFHNSISFKLKISDSLSWISPSKSIHEPFCPSSIVQFCLVEVALIESHVNIHNKFKIFHILHNIIQEIETISMLCSITKFHPVMWKIGKTFFFSQLSFIPGILVKCEYHIHCL